MLRLVDVVHALRLLLLLVEVMVEVHQVQDGVHLHVEWKTSLDELKAVFFDQKVVIEDDVLLLLKMLEV
eukprot:916152-Ditylum_brightwellii.AAC.1